jgi:hypothetical protein
MTSSSDLETYGIFLVIIVFILARRTAMMVRGTPLRVGRLVGIAVVYIALFAFAIGFDLLIEPWWVGVIDLAVVVSAAVLLPAYIESRVTVYRGPGGAWYYRLGYLVPAVYLVLFVARLGIEFGVLNIDPFDTTPFTTTFTNFQLALLALVDGLFAFSTGLLVARTVAVYRVYQRTVAAEPKPVVAPPLP